jgi:spoIIIJ-associated protein
MEWVETTGRSIDAALDAALDELGVDEEDVEFEVLQEPKSGMFGIGRSDARIRARVKPLSREKPGERQRRRGGRKEGGSRGRGGKGGGSRNEPSRESNGSRAGGNGKPKAEGAKASAGAATAADAGDGAAEAIEGAAGSAGAAVGGVSSSAKRRRRGGRGRGSGGGGQGSEGGNARPQGDADRDGAGEGTNEGRDGHSGRPESKQGAAPKLRSEDRTRNEESAAVSTEEDVPIEEQAAAAEEFTRGLVEAFDLGGTVSTVIDDDVVTVQVDGENLGLLVGPKGATLHAIEELVRTVVQRQTDGHGVRIHVDVAGYRAKRRVALEGFTKKLVDKVLETGKAQALEPMSAADRKVVHDTAATFDGIMTESDGEEPRRRVVIRRA